MSEFRDKLLSIAVHRPRASTAEPRRWDETMSKDLDSYKRVVKSGLEPETLVGAHALERELGG